LHIFGVVVALYGSRRELGNRGRGVQIEGSHSFSHKIRLIVPKLPQIQ
jgi:hypothetical protein